MKGWINAKLETKWGQFWALFLGMILAATFGHLRRCSIVGLREVTVEQNFVVAKEVGLDLRSS